MNSSPLQSTHYLLHIHRPIYVISIFILYHIIHVGCDLDDMRNTALTTKNAHFPKYKIPIPIRGLIDANPIPKYSLETREICHRRNCRMELFVAKFIVSMIVPVVTNTNLKITHESCKYRRTILQYAAEFILWVESLVNISGFETPVAKVVTW